MSDAIIASVMGKYSSRPFNPVIARPPMSPLSRKGPRLGLQWSRPQHASVTEERDGKRADAANRLFLCAKYLEGWHLVLGVRAFAPSDEELRELLTPPRPGTALRHVRMFNRFRMFIEADPLVHTKGLVMDAATTSRWITDLIAHQVGRFTPGAALGCLSYLSDILDFPFTGTPTLLLTKVAMYRDDPDVEKNQAPPYSLKFLRWLEVTALGRWNSNPVDRLVCGRLRIAANASTRMDDQRRTPARRTQWVLDRNGRVRAIVTRASSTKTFPRHWSCSVYAVDCANDGWLEATLDLLKEAHGNSWETDDHFGKCALPDRSGWDIGPPSPQADTCHIRQLMMEYSSGPAAHGEGFDVQEVACIRSHGAKCTFIKLAQELGVSRRDQRQQGGWRGDKEDIMPDTYARSSQVRSLFLQERVLRHLREGGAWTTSSTVPILDVPHPVRGGPLQPINPAEATHVVCGEEVREDSAASEPDPDASSASSVDGENSKASSEASDTDCSDDDDFVREFLVNVVTNKYHRPAPSHGLTSVLETVHRGDHEVKSVLSRVHRVMSDHSIPTHLLRRKVIVESLDENQVGYGDDTDWDQVLFPVRILLKEEVWVPSCHRPAASMTLISALEFHKSVHNRNFSACDVYFPKEFKKMQDGCKHICGFQKSARVCAVRCVNLGSSSELTDMASEMRLFLATVDADRTDERSAPFPPSPV